MSECHIISFTMCMSIMFVLTLIFSALHVEMLFYDSGEVYSCSSDQVASFVEGVQVRAEKDQGKAFSHDSVTTELFEDPFYDPMECPSLFLDSQEPVWFGRVEHMTLHH